MSRARVAALVLVAAVIAVAVWMLVRERDAGPLPEGPAVAPTTPAAEAASGAVSARLSPPESLAETRIAPRAASAEEPDAPGPVIMVVIVDSAGRPLEGVRALLIWLVGDNRDPYPVEASEPSDASGQAWIRIGRSDYTPRANDDRPSVYAVRSEIPEVRPAEVEVNPMQPPSDPIRLVIGDTGSAVVRVVDHENRPIAEPAVVSLVPIERDYLQLWLPERCHRRVVGGEVRYERVGVGARVYARAHLPGRRDLVGGNADGPRQSGEEVTITLEADLRHPMVSGRILDVDGNPMRGGTLFASITSRDEVSPSLAVRVEASGGFRVEVREARYSGFPRTLVLEAKTAGLVEARAAADLSRDLPHGETDVGDVRLTRAELPPLALAGRIVDERGAPVEKARVLLQSTTPAKPPEQPRERAKTVEDLWQRQSDAAGRFELRGTCDAPNLRVTAFKDGYWSPNPIPVEAGASDVVLRLNRGAAIAGSVLLSPEGRKEKLMVQARLEADDGEPRSYGAGGFNRVQKDGSFLLRGMRPGRFTVLLGLGQTGMPMALAEFRDVRLEAGETSRDPRLQNVDLTGLATVTLTVVDASGGPVGNASAALIGAGPSGSYARWGVTHSGGGANGTEIKLLLPKRPADVKVGSRGFRPTVARGVDSDRQVVLQKGIPIRVVLSEPIEAPERVGVEVYLHPEAVMSPPPDLRAADLVSAGAGTVLPRKAREAAFPISEPGRYQLWVNLNGTTQQQVTMEPVVVHDSDVEQTFVVTVTPEAVEKALKRLGAQ
jgi:hypothetical protein